MVNLIRGNKNLLPLCVSGGQGGQGGQTKKTKFRVKVDKELMWDLGNCQMSHMWDRITVLIKMWDPGTIPNSEGLPNVPHFQFFLKKT